MALADITKSILDEAAAQREQVLKDAEERADAAREQEQQQFEALKKGKTAELKQEEERIKRSVRVTTAMQLRAFELEKKRDVMATVRERVLSQLQQLDDAAYTALLAKQFAALTTSEGEVTPAKGRQAATEAAVRQASKSYTVHGEDHGLTGGFILTHGDLTIDGRFTTLVDRYFADNEHAVAERLFPAS